MSILEAITKPSKISKASLNALWMEATLHEISLIRKNKTETLEDLFYHMKPIITK